MTKEYCFVLDFMLAQVHRVELPDGDVELEDFLTEKGFSTSNCQWMVTSDNSIYTND